MMRCLAVIILLCLIAQVNATSAAANHAIDMQDSMDNSGDQLLDNIFDRALKARLLDHSSLDGAILSKTKLPEQEGASESTRRSFQFSRFQLPKEAVVDPATNIAFAPSAGPLGLMGVGVRVKKIGPVAVKVYSVGLYADTGTVCKTVKSEPPGGEKFYNAIAGAKANKELLLKFARGVGTDKVADALSKVAGVPEKALTEFGTLLRDAIGTSGVKAGETITLGWPEGDGELIVGVRGKRAGVVKDRSLPSGVFGMFLGSASVSPPLRKDIASHFQCA